RPLFPADPWIFHNMSYANHHSTGVVAGLAPLPADRALSRSSRRPSTRSMQRGLRPQGWRQPGRTAVLAAAWLGASSATTAASDPRPTTVAPDGMAAATRATAVMTSDLRMEDLRDGDAAWRRRERSGGPSR